MNVRDLMKALHTAEQLKDTLRHCDTSRWTKRKRGGTQPESVSNGLLDQ